MTDRDDHLAELDRRIREKSERAKAKEFSNFDPDTPVVNAGEFSQQVADLARTMAFKVQREGLSLLPNPRATTDIEIILRQLYWTYNLLCWINADDTRHGPTGYQTPYTFVSLPLVRTIIDGFYNCTALLEDPSKDRIFRISGYYRLRQALKEDQDKYQDDPAWAQDFHGRERLLKMGLYNDGLTDADLNDKGNKWPLLGAYLSSKPDTPNKQLLRRISLGLWREYSSISHASYDGLAQLFQFIARDHLPHEMRNARLNDFQHRSRTMHFTRAAVLLLALVTELQHYFKFEGANIDGRLRKTWTAMMPIYEAKELYDFRYNSILREPEIQK